MMKQLCSQRPRRLPGAAGVSESQRLARTNEDFSRSMREMF